MIDFCKGGYAPTFHKRETAPLGVRSAQPPARPLHDWKTAALIAALLLAGGATSWAMILHRRNLSLQRQVATARPMPAQEFAPVWGPFLAPETPTFVIFGSPMFFASPRQGLFLRRPDLNDPANLQSDSRYQLLQQNFGALDGPRYDYAEIGDAIALQRLTAFFGRQGKTLAALPAHAATWETIKDGHLIFLGAPRMDPLLHKLPIQQDFEWGDDNNIYNRRPQPGEQPVYTTSDHRDAVTYAIVACFPGLRPNRHLLLLTAHSAPGTMAAVDYVTGPESVRALTEKLQLFAQAGPHYYQVLLRVFVDKGTPVKTEYVTHHPVGELSGRQ